MDFDFYEQYKNYSNIDLLKITKRPKDYQQAAVIIAAQILNERIVSPEENELADRYLEEIDNVNKTGNGKIDGYTNDADQLFEPGEKKSAGKWFSILFFLIVLQYGIILISALLHLLMFWSGKLSFTTFLSIELIELIYIPTTFYLLYKKNPFGWILLFAQELWMLLGLLAAWFLSFNNQHIHNGNSLSPILLILANAAFIFFLWKDTVGDYFGVTKNNKKFAMSLAVIVGIATILIIIFIV